MFESIKKWLASVAAEPYLHVEMRINKAGSLEVNSMYNKHLIHHLDKVYKKSAYLYDPEAEEDQKVAIFLYDCFSELTAEFLPEPPEEEDIPEDPFANIPPLVGRGGADGREVRQVVDLADIDKSKEPGVRPIDIVG